MAAPALLALLALAASASAGSRAVVVSVVGTTDLHGAIFVRDGGGLERFAGYLANLRAARAGDGGVLLLDSGDLFQGTLESNLTEGAAVIRAYNHLGYDAAVIGNHEFDYGPEGPAASPRAPGDDPFGALRRRLAEARFPFLAANLVERSTHRPPSWPNLRPAVLLERAGLPIGVVGGTTRNTLAMTLAANVRGLAVTPLAEAIRREAQALRAAGARAVVAAVHAGGRCRDFSSPDDATSCDADAEAVELARDLAPGGVDLILAGHTHEAMAHRISGIPVLQAWSSGRGFSRADLVFDPDRGRLTEVRIHPPREVCAPARRGRPPCPTDYEGRPVRADPALAALLAPDLERAREARERRLGPVVAARIPRSYDTESALGNLFADLMLEARPRAQVALTNGGGLRADLRAGPLTYGAIYEAYPFDNRFAFVRTDGTGLARLLARNLAEGGGILLVAGTRVEARCRDGRVEVTTRFAPDEPVEIVTSDFLATSADFRDFPPGSIRIEEEGSLLRDELAARLAARGGRLHPASFHDPRAPRIVLPGPRPLTCGRSPRRRGRR